jgi:hypothetical protein
MKNPVIFRGAEVRKLSQNENFVEKVMAIGQSRGNSNAATGY